MNYFEKLQDPRWQKKRLQIMERDKFACRDCGDNEHTLQVHHCAYCGEPWEAPPRLLLTLCDDCHQARQKLEDAARQILGKIFSQCKGAELEEIILLFELDYQTRSQGWISPLLAMGEKIRELRSKERACPTA